ncbi:hypothetical protein RRG08_049082 [Elysia crispata]|uniref:Uncharacterized protein n=1 Tax=Elysia crispata TaxID=231223 RepID=A0AAE1DV63_9GAST|nr:hypothetical protein RRG08_049082 [Elysia crispata]
MMGSQKSVLLHFKLSASRLSDLDRRRAFSVTDLGVAARSELGKTLWTSPHSGCRSLGADGRGMHYRPCCQGLQGHREFPAEDLRTAGVRRTLDTCLPSFILSLIPIMRQVPHRVRCTLPRAPGIRLA